MATLDLMLPYYGPLHLLQATVRSVSAQQDPRVPAKLIWLLQEQWEDASGMSAEVSAGGGDVARAGAAEQADR